MVTQVDFNIGLFVFWQISNPTSVIAKYAYVYMVKPLDPSFYLGTDNKFNAETDIMCWSYIVSECKK